jgi:hypothetical protein
MMPVRANDAVPGYYAEAVLNLYGRMELEAEDFS